MKCLNLHVFPQPCDLICKIKEHVSNIFIKIHDHIRFANVNVFSFNKTPIVETLGKNEKLDISVGLVCSTGIDQWDVFYVIEGPFVVEDGMFNVIKRK